MKIRTGFVSNSSSSSFCIYGIEMGISKAKEFFKEHEFDDFGEFLDGNLNMEYMLDYETGIAYFGRSPFNIGDDETGKQFRDSVKDEIKKVFGEEFVKDCGAIQEVIAS